MQYDIDTHGEFADIFKKIRTILLSYPQIKELKNAKHKLKEYFNNELDCEIGQFDAESLLEFISKEIGVYHYNKGLQDAQDIFKQKVESVTDAIYEIEMTTKRQ